MKTQNALFSVYDKRGVVDFANEIAVFGYTIISSQNTASALSKGGVVVDDITRLSGFPSILDHTVVTFHPVIYGALVSENKESHHIERKKYHIPWIDLAYLGFYPLQKAIDEGVSKDNIIKMIDTGGPALASTAAKGGRIVICDPDDCEMVLDVFKTGNDTTELKKYLCWKAFDECQKYNKIAEEYFRQFVPAKFKVQK